MKTLVAASLAVALAINLSMVTVLLTRRTYPGFGHWVAGTLCRTAGSALILLRDQLPLWATVVLANTLLLGDIVLNLHGLQIFRDRPAPIAVKLAAGLSFAALFAWLTYGAPDINARIVVLCLYTGVFELWAVGVLLARRPPYFGSGDLMTAATLGGLALLGLGRTLYTVFAEPPLANFLTASHQAVFVLLSLMAMLLLALGQIIMNAQRIEYDHRQTQCRLEQDIAARERVETALRESEEKFRLAFHNANTGMCLVDMQGRLLQVNDKMTAIFGYARDELTAMTVNDLSLPEDLAISPRFIGEAVGGGADNITFNKRYRHKLGHIVHGEVASSLVRDGHGRPLYFISQVQDVGARLDMEAQLREQAIREPLTGLYNRRYLDATIPGELERHRRTGAPLTLAMVDIDRFKRFNDDHGHEAGDSVLRAVGALVKGLLRDGETACRYGGEELVLILPGTGPAQAAARLEPLRQAAMQLRPLFRGGTLPPVSVSIGVAAARPGDADPASLLARADAAMYRAKGEGRNRIVVLDDPAI